MAGLLDFGGGLLGNLGAAAQNFLHSPSTLGAIGDAITGLTTGQRTDPIGYMQQQQQQLFQGLVANGVPAQRAAVAVQSPDAFKAEIAKLYPTFSAHNIGNTVGSFNAQSGQFNPQYIAPEFKTVGAGDIGISYQPPLPGRGAPSSAIQAQPLAPPSGANGPMPLAGGTQTLVPGMSVQDKSAAEAAGKVQGQSAATLPNTLAGADQALKIIDEVQNHPGKNASVGPFAGHIPAIVPQTQNFVAKLSELQGKTFLQAYNQLKGAGAISNTEGAKAETAIAALTRAQSVPQFDAALNDLRDVIKTGRANAIRIAKGETAPTSAEMNPPASTPNNGGWTQVTPNIRVRPK